MERTHLGEDVYRSLLVGGGIISVKPNVGRRNIEITANTSPAENVRNVSSVGREKKVGNSEKFAREDHAHDLRINERSPNDGGQFVLSPGANVTIENGAGENELVISASASQAAFISTGIFLFERVLPGETRVSPPIPHDLETQLVAVVTASEVSVACSGTSSARAAAWARPG